MHEQLQQLEKSIRRLFGRGVGAARVELAPRRDWVLILTGTVVLALVMAGLGVYVFAVAHQRDVSGILAPTSRTAIDPARLDSVVTRYRARTQELDQLRTGDLAAPDPGVVSTATDTDDGSADALATSTAPDITVRE